MAQLSYHFFLLIFHIPILVVVAELLCGKKKLKYVALSHQSVSKINMSFVFYKEKKGVIKICYLSCSKHDIRILKKVACNSSS